MFDRLDEHLRAKADREARQWWNMSPAQREAKNNASRQRWGSVLLFVALPIELIGGVSAAVTGLWSPPPGATWAAVWVPLAAVIALTLVVGLAEHSAGGPPRPRSKPTRDPRKPGA